MEQAAAARPAPASGPPIALFAAVMGIASLGLGWREAALAFRVPGAIGAGILALSALLFVVLTIRYARKLIRAPASVRGEFDDPIVSSYFGTVTISLGLLAAGLEPYARDAAIAVWAISAVASVVLLLVLLARWIRLPRELGHITPGLFIPVVGNAIGVYAAVPLGFPEAAYALFAIALICWLTLQPLVFYRLIFHEPLPLRLMPGLAILVSSPAVLASAWFGLNGGHADAAFRILGVTALLFAALVGMLTHWAFRVAFSPGWWGYTFPAAALAGALMRYAAAMETPFAAGLAWCGLIAATLIVLYVGARSVAAYAVTARHRSAAP